MLIPSLEFQLEKQSQTHYYRRSQEIHDHVFAPKSGGIMAYMTGEGKGIQPGDYLILGDDYQSQQYQVDKINYYATPPDMWIALLKQVRG
ncbi:MAG TPA: hypothetical protein DEA78_22085 [Cyanobacteria bacterium UBA11159]|nr:hypothetical protein [Cyanobacteria bacterium UBA11367]HBE56098.1 hypothetical protein [Cyanobacteria bacterium UBA11366]HBK63828.1 hypothetical protein [Cyanobacteria bacterium UBA11166]HBR76302.1 hypothetical protein [Cyanobacteria bacterium UBA11159]HBS72252.1 hypothetical protein [Cyanobacteria bacterium UBA11153]HCA96666.1 hypothetical protein [Cyanobacteria bacterium UBA9226]